MARLKIFVIILVVCLSLVMLTGCNDDLKIANERQRAEIKKLSGDAQANKLTIAQLNNKLNDADGNCQVKTNGLQQTITALETDIDKKTDLINSMRDQLMLGGLALPVELSTMLEDFAKSAPDLVSYDSARGLLKFKSDLLFEKGSDQVTVNAAEAIKTLSGILNSEEGKNFDCIIAGHTDDMRIARAETRAQHPTNWHLSVHRAISVLKAMETNGISPERMSARGFGEYRPLQPNAPNQGGNPANRRVEIYIVPKGT